MIPTPQYRLQWSRESHEKIKFGETLELKAIGCKFISIEKAGIVVEHHDENPTSFTVTPVLSMAYSCAHIDILKVWGEYTIGRIKTKATIEYYESGELKTRLVDIPELHVFAVNAYELEENNPMPDCDDNEERPDCIPDPDPDPDPVPDPDLDIDPEEPFVKPVTLKQTVITSKTHKATIEFSHMIVDIDEEKFGIINSTEYNILDIIHDGTNKILVEYTSATPNDHENDLLFKLMFKEGAITFMVDDERYANEYPITARLMLYMRVDYIEEIYSALETLNPDYQFTPEIRRIMREHLYEILFYATNAGNIGEMESFRIRNFINCYINAFNNKYFKGLDLTGLYSSRMPVTVTADDITVSYGNNNSNEIYSINSCLDALSLMSMATSKKGKANAVAHVKQTYRIRYRELV